MRDIFFFFFSSRRRHTRYIGDWSSDVCSSDLRTLPDLNLSVVSAIISKANQLATIGADDQLRDGLLI